MESWPSKESMKTMLAEETPSRRNFKAAEGFEEVLPSY
jgi:hypothetical protein